MGQASLTNKSYLIENQIDRYWVGGLRSFAVDGQVNLELRQWSNHV
jgi:hypothetical protein